MCTKRGGKKRKGGEERIRKGRRREERIKKGSE